MIQEYLEQIEIDTAQKVEFPIVMFAFNSKTPV